MFGSSRQILYLKFILVMTAIFAGAFLAADDTARCYLIDGAYTGTKFIIQLLPLLLSFVITLFIGVLAFRK